MSLPADDVDAHLGRGVHFSVSASADGSGSGSDQAHGSPPTSSSTSTAAVADRTGQSRSMPKPKPNHKLQLRGPALLSTGPQAHDHGRSMSLPHSKLSQMTAGAGAGDDSDEDTGGAREDMTPIRHVPKTRSRSTLAGMMGQSMGNLHERGYGGDSPLSGSPAEMLSGQERRRDSYMVANLRIDAHQKSRANTQFVKSIEERDKRVMERVSLVSQMLSGRKMRRAKDSDVEAAPTLADTIASLSAERDQDRHIVGENDESNSSVGDVKAGGDMRQWIEGKREATRQAVIQRSAVEKAEAKTRNQAKAHAEGMRRLEAKLKALEEEAFAARKAESDARARASRERDKCAAAERVAGLLRSRLRQLSARRMETERKLVVFERFMPLFEVLSERYDYSVTPEALISRLEVLERAQTELLSDLMAAQERVAALERESAAKQRDWENERQRLATEYTLSQERIERRGNALELSVRGTEDEVEALKLKVERAARLESSLNDLWQAVMPVEWAEWEAAEREEKRRMRAERRAQSRARANGVLGGGDGGETSPARMLAARQALLPGVGEHGSGSGSGHRHGDTDGVLGVGARTRAGAGAGAVAGGETDSSSDSDSELDADNIRMNVRHPEQIVSALTLVLTMRHPERKEAALRKLSGLAHRVWLRWYAEGCPDLKSRPFATFERLLTDHDALIRDYAALQVKLEAANKEKLELLDSLPASSPMKRGRIPLRTPISQRTKANPNPNPNPKAQSEAKEGASKSATRAHQGLEEERPTYPPRAETHLGFF